MHELQIALDESRELQDQIAGLQERTLRNRLKHGLVLDLNPFWDYSRRLEAAGLDPHLVYDIIYGYVGAPAFSPPSPGRADLSRHYPHSEDVSRRAFGKRPAYGPFMLRILAAPCDSTEDLELRSELVAAAREAPIPAIVETDERAFPVHQSGDRIKTSLDTGTLGGFVRDTLTGENYAMTCGHVVATGETVSSLTGSLGDCRHHVAPIPAMPDVTGAVSADQITHNDIALIELRGTPPTNRANAIRGVLNKGDLVEMAGTASGLRTYELGGLMVDLDVAGSVWKNLIQLHAPTSGIFPQLFRDIRCPPPRRGDSGAWIFHQDTAWGGMVVAASGKFGYALPATTTLADANQRFGLSLALA